MDVSRAWTLVVALVVVLVAGPLHSQAYIDYILKQKSSDRLGKAMEAMVDRRLGDCISLATAAITTDPSDANGYFVRGSCRFWSNEPKNALDDISKGLALAPGRSEARAERGLIYRDLGENEKALADFDAALKVMPRSHTTQYNRGLALLDLGRHKEAIAAFDRAIALEANDPDYFADRCLAKLRSDAAGALADAERSVALVTTLGGGRTGGPKAGPAISSTPKGAAPGKGSERYYMVYGNALQQKERWADADAAYSKAIEIAPGYGEAYLNRAIVRMALNREDDAVRDLETGARLAPAAYKRLKDQLK